MPPRCLRVQVERTREQERRGVMYTWQIERWAGLCRLAVEETDKNKFLSDLSDAYNAILERLQSLQGLRKQEEELLAMKSAMKQLKRRKRTLERPERENSPSPLIGRRQSYVKRDTPPEDAQKTKVSP